MLAITCLLSDMRAGNVILCDLVFPGRYIMSEQLLRKCCFSERDYVIMKYCCVIYLYHVTILSLKEK